ncbi:MAG: CopG family transcriptional regulator [Oscillospiraceae bacterium]|nr:CopG family transcriptional regulator [Oscillospiraceae bacterium]
MAGELIVKPKRPKGEDGHRVFSVRLPEETVVRLDKFAAQSGRSRNELIGMFLNYALEHCKISDQ